jgi:hypothetical protein
VSEILNKSSSKIKKEGDVQPTASLEKKLQLIEDSQQQEQEESKYSAYVKDDDSLLISSLYFKFPKN